MLGFKLFLKISYCNGRPFLKSALLANPGSSGGGALAPRLLPSTVRRAGEQVDEERPRGRRAHTPQGEANLLSYWPLP